MNPAIRHIKQAIPAFLLLIGIAGALPAQAAYTIKTIDFPGALTTQFWGISSTGQIAGFADFDNFATPGTSFVYDTRNGTFTVLPTVPSEGVTAAFGVNKSGVVVGSATSADSSAETGLIIKQGAFTFFSHPGTPFTEGRGINDPGLITGFVTPLSATDPAFGFIYNQSTRSFADILPLHSYFTLAHGINKQGQVVGSTSFANADEAYAGAIAGTFAFMRNTNGVITLFQVNGYLNSTSARGITGTGRVAGFFSDSDAAGKRRGFVGSLARVNSHLLNVTGADVLDGDPTATDTFIESMNDSGKIVGFWIDASGSGHGFVATPIPPKKK